MSIKDWITSMWRQKNVRQVASLFSVNMIGIPLGIVTNIVVTRYLGAKLFGDYKFICSVFNFAALIVTLGFFQAGNRAVVLSNDKEKTRGFYGVMMMILACLYVLMAAGITAFSLLDHNVASKGLSFFLICVCPLSFITLWGVMYETVLPADNQIGILSRIRLYPKALNLLGACALYFFARNKNWDNLLVILLLYNSTQLLMYCYVSVKLKPNLRNFKERLSEILTYNRSFGFNVYIGSLFAVGFNYLTEILISYFGADNVEVGFYSLAFSLSQPLLFIPSTIATTHYKEFSTSKSISKKILMTTLGLSGVAVLLLWILVPPFVKFCYGTEFLPVIGINFFVCIGIFMHGMADFYNRFVQASGKGAWLRDASFIVGFATLLANVLLIPHFGAYGAAYSKIVSGFVYLSTIYVYYRKTCKEK